MTHDAPERRFTLADHRWHADTHFDTAVRGSHRGQVDRFLVALDELEVDLVHRARDAEQRLADARSELVRLCVGLARRPLTPAAAPPAAWLGHQLEQAPTLAEQEAERIRAALVCRSACNSIRSSPATTLHPTILHPHLRPRGAAT